MKTTKTMPDGTKATIVYSVDGEPIEQVVTKVESDKVWVKSSKGNEYPVMLSDKVRMTDTVNVGDIAIIKTFKKGWIVFDIIHKDIEEELSGEEERLETERQIKDFEDLLGGY